MIFSKPLFDLKFPDIERLKADKICESPILDYKKEILHDNDLLKHISAFANTQGGVLIFGVEESGKGGWPNEIEGIEKHLINKERMEQLILGNIHPRLNVEIVQFDHNNPLKSIVVLRIPNNNFKPYMHGRYNRFYKRYNFEAQPMNEIEVSEAYKRRFSGFQEVEKYISELLKWSFGEGETFLWNQIIGKIIIIPTLPNRMIDTSNAKNFDWITNLDFKPKFYDLTFIPSHPTPSPNGVKCQLLTQSGYVRDKLEIHRNGCIQHSSYFGEKDGDTILFLHHIFCIKLLHSLQFSSILLKKYDYFGDVKIICSLEPMTNSRLLDLRRNSGMQEYPCQKNEIITSREFPISIIESKYSYVASGIMDDIFNSYGIWKCPLFDDEGNFKESELKF